MALSSKPKYVSVIIFDSPHFKLHENGNLEKLISWLKVHSQFYAMNYHDRDREADNETPEAPHLHINFIAFPTEGSKDKDKKVYQALSTHLYSLDECLHCGVDYITISKISDWVGNLRYLLHLDEVLPNKYHYERRCLMSSDDKMYDRLIGQDSDVLSVHQLYKIIIDSDYSLYEILSRMGIDTYRKYRYVVLDIVKTHKMELKG